MITVGIVAGLGNQMFQYALGKKLAVTQKQDLYLDTDPLFYDIRNYELGVFNIEPKFATSKQKPRYQKLFKKKALDKARYPLMWVSKKIDKNYIIENPRHPKIYPGMFDFHPSVLVPRKGDIYLEGFWQSEKYFDDIKDIIRKDFTLKTPISDPQNVEIIEKMKATNSVSLHVRRTDYIGSYFAGISTPEYYERSIKYMLDNVENPTFFVFSDDIAWCRENLNTGGQQTYFIDWNTKANSYKDLILMSNCKNNIIANSSFSRRGAWLNANPSKIVIAPTKHHQNIDYKDIIPSEWIRL